MIKVAIVGASGYTGIELIRILALHEHVRIEALVADSSSGKFLGEVFPAYQHLKLPKIQKLDAVNLGECDAAFFCLPHGTSREVIERCYIGFPKLKIFDLSADFRIYDAGLYNSFYGNNLTHYTDTGVISSDDVAFGLTELYYDNIRSSRVVACPGCYPTSILLPLMPVVRSLGGRSGSVKSSILGSVVIDSKSGITGAGRRECVAHLFAEKNEMVFPYSPLEHRHLSEIVQGTGLSEDRIMFIPNLVPMSRGILSSIYLSLGKDVDVRRAITEYYGAVGRRCGGDHGALPGSRFVSLVNDPPSTKDVVGTNYCRIFVRQKSSNVAIMSVIDNLCKGSSGQAVQNMNISFGLDEGCGLNIMPVFP